MAPDPKQIKPGDINAPHHVQSGGGGAILDTCVMMTLYMGAMDPVSFGFDNSLSSKEIPLAILLHWYLMITISCEPNQQAQMVPTPIRGIIARDGEDIPNGLKRN
ncbi:hypothetical protein VNO78_12121 [Psophocarpus tetragonolobus]|uniref:Uncharacterized protein n=1 Tax=Psophocarpus tetragonolobus TaxID=3891 RepID=A0AAN9SMG2_PSOTE